MENTPVTSQGSNTETSREAPAVGAAPPRDRRTVVLALPVARRPLVGAMPMALPVSHGRVVRRVPVSRPVGPEPVIHRPLVRGLPVALPMVPLPVGRPLIDGVPLPLPAGYGSGRGAPMAASAMTALPVGHPPLVRGVPAAYVPTNQALPHANAVPVRTLTADTSSHMKCVRCDRGFGFGRPLRLVALSPMFPYDNPITAGTVLRPPPASAVAASPFPVCSDPEHFKLTMQQTGMAAPVLVPWHVPSPQPGGQGEQVHVDSEIPPSSPVGPDPAGI